MSPSPGNWLAALRADLTLGMTAICIFVAKFKSTKIFLRKILSGVPSVSNNLDPDQAQCFVRPDLEPNCLQRL